MFRDITIGQYYPVNSILHRLDPRVKLLGVVVYIAAMFVINNVYGLIFLGASAIALVVMSKVPLKYILKGLRFVWFLVILAVFFNLFFSLNLTILYYLIIFNDQCCQLSAIDTSGIYGDIISFIQPKGRTSFSQEHGGGMAEDYLLPIPPGVKVEVLPSPQKSISVLPVHGSAFVNTGMNIDEMLILMV